LCLIVSFWFAGRSAWSTCWCVLETVLSAFVFVHGIQRVALIVWYFPNDFGFYAPWISVVLCTACVVYTGLCGVICSSRVQNAVLKMKSDHESEIDLLEHGRRAGSRGLGGIDLFEYHDVISISLNVSKVISCWLLFIVFVLGCCLLLIVNLLLFPFSFSSSKFNDGISVVAFLTSVCLWFVYYVRLIYSRGVIGRIMAFREECRSHPFHAHVQALLLMSSIAYAIFLYFSHISYSWFWSLILVRIVRMLKVWVDLHGQNQGSVSARGEVAGDMP